MVRKPLPAVAVKRFSSESPGPCSGQNSIGLQTNCSSLSQNRKPPSAGWWDLVSATDSAAPCLLLCVCSSLLGAAALLAGLMNAEVPPPPSHGNDDFLKKEWKKEEERTESCTATSSFSPSSYILAKHLLRLQVPHPPKALLLV